MNRWLALAIVGVMLVVPSVSAGASWTQAGYDAASTGHSPGAGPKLNATAFSTTLPSQVPKGFGGGLGTTVVSDGIAYTAVGPYTDDAPGSDGIARIDLATGEVGMFAETETGVTALALDGDRMIATLDGTGVAAFNIDTGETLWQADEEDVEDVTFCWPPTVADGLVYLPCTGQRDGLEQYENAIIPFVWVVDAETGETEWDKVLSRTVYTQDAREATSDVPTRRGWTLGVSVSDAGVFATTFEVDQVFQCAAVTCATVCCTTAHTLWALDPGSGDVRWSNSTDPGVPHGYGCMGTDGCDVNLFDASPAEIERAFPAVPGRVTVTDRVVYANIDGGSIQAFNANQGEPLWGKALGQKDTTGQNFRTPGSALVGDALYVSSAQSIYRFDAENEGHLDWRVSIELGEAMSGSSLMVADGVLYATTNGDGYSAIYALDTDTGERLWRHEIRVGGDEGEPNLVSSGLGDGVLVATDSGEYDSKRPGTVHIIGQTGASPEPVIETSSSMPAEGEMVSVNLSRTQPGAFGPATRYKAEWGDGNTTGWQPDPVLEHAYSQEGEHTARFWVANENQTASQTHTFDVGATEPNWLSERFEPENQDMTFGVLGVALALGGGVVGATKRYRKRSRLEEELETLEQGYEETKDRPGECEAFLETRRARARSLVLDGVLTEEQGTIVKDRADELRRELRTQALEDEFGFLPHALVIKARQMLEDGRVTTLEVEAFESALKEVEGISDEQRTVVRERLQAWKARDEGGNPR